MERNKTIHIIVFMTEIRSVCRNVPWIRFKYIHNYYVAAGDGLIKTIILSTWHDIVLSISTFAQPCEVANSNALFLFSILVYCNGWWSWCKWLYNRDPSLIVNGWTLLRDNLAFKIATTNIYRFKCKIIQKIIVAIHSNIYVILDCSNKFIENVFKLFKNMCCI